MSRTDASHVAQGKATRILTAVILELALLGAGGDTLAGKAGAGQMDVRAQGATTPATRPVPISFVYAQPSAVFTPIFVAQDQNFFAKQGLEVSFTQATGNTAVATLISGESQVIGTGATEVAGVAVAGSDVVMVAAGSNYPLFSLYVDPTVHSVQDLIGKKIAVTRPGTSTDTTARIILEHYGLGGKVEIVSAGGTLSGVLATMKAGITAGGIFSPPSTTIAEAAGFRELVNGFRLGIPMTHMAIAVKKSYLAQHRRTVLGFMKAYLAGWAFIRNPVNEAVVESAIIHYTRVSQEQSAVAYKAASLVWQQTELPMVDPVAVKNTLRFSSNARVRGVNPTTLIDTSLLDELVQSGYVKSLYQK